MSKIIFNSGNFRHWQPKYLPRASRDKLTQMTNKIQVGKGRTLIVEFVKKIEKKNIYKLSKYIIQYNTLVKLKYTA